jgi:UDP-N-acetylglucosamine 1-carboxyvinyltransferase
MGARIKLGGRTAIIEGGHELISAPLRAMDLRGGAAFIIAGLISHGETIITGVEHIDRGYEQIEERFQQLGVSVERRIISKVFPGK